MKTKRIKARMMFAAPERGNSHQQWFTLSSKRDDKIFCDFTRPVHVIPAYAESYERMVEQMARAMAPNSWDRLAQRPFLRNDARAALAAIGITKPKAAK
jgi:hypothetical protein